MTSQQTIKYWQDRYAQGTTEAVAGWVSRQIHIPRFNAHQLEAIDRMKASAPTNSHASEAEELLLTGLEQDNDFIIEHLLKFAPNPHGKPLRIIDFGSGGGELLHKIAARIDGQIDAIGIDIAEDAINRLNQSAAQTKTTTGIVGGIDALQALADTKELRGTFDAIVSRETIYNLSDTEKAQLFECAKSLCKTDGVVLITGCVAQAGSPSELILAADARDRQMSTGDIMTFTNFTDDDPVQRLVGGFDRLWHEHDHAAVRACYSLTQLVYPPTDQPAAGTENYTGIAQADPATSSRYAAIYRAIAT